MWLACNRGARRGNSLGSSGRHCGIRLGNQPIRPVGCRAGGYLPTSSSVPLEVSLPGGVGVTAISSAGDTTLALGSDGDVYAWGWNPYGQLGDGSTTDSGTPVQVPLPNGVTATAVYEGGLTSGALGSDGNIYVWGDDISAPGSQASYSSVPVEVPMPGGLRATAVTVGFTSIQALGSDGNIYEWNNDGSGTHLATPTEMSLPGGVATTAIAGDIAIGSDGNVYDWGDNLYGQPGDGSTTSSSTPVRVPLPAGSQQSRCPAARTLTSRWVQTATSTPGDRMTLGSLATGRLPILDARARLAQSWLYREARALVGPASLVGMPSSTAPLGVPCSAPRASRASQASPPGVRRTLIGAPSASR